MHAEIVVEHLLFIRLNPIKLRAGEYIHVRDVICTERNTADIGRLNIGRRVGLSVERQPTSYV